MCSSGAIRGFIEEYTMTIFNQAQKQTLVVVLGAFGLGLMAAFLDWLR
jgi:hypothetical protein